jgi:transposase
MAVPVQLRAKVLAALDRGESAASIARRFEIGERTVYRLQRRQRQGLPLTPAKSGPKGFVKLTQQDLQLLREAVQRQPGITAKQMIPQLSVQVVESTVCRAWKRLGLSSKKSR